MDDPLIIKVLLYSLGSILGGLGLGLRYIMNKLHVIVPEEEIRRMISDNAAPQDVKQQMIYDRLVHIENLLYSLLEKTQSNGRRQQE